MKISVINARVRRNHLIEHAGDCFRDVNSRIVQDIQNNEDTRVFVGIESEVLNNYTIIGESFVFFQTEMADRDKIPLSDFLVLLKKNAWQQGKSGIFDFLPLGDGRRIWIMNPQTMTSLWNTAMLFTSLKV